MEGAETSLFIFDGRHGDSLAMSGIGAKVSNLVLHVCGINVAQSDLQAKA